MNDGKNVFWLLAAAAVAFYFWQNNGNQPTSQMEKDLANCQAEFKAFKDGLTYGRN